MITIESSIKLTEKLIPVRMLLKQFHFVSNFIRSAPVVSSFILRTDFKSETPAVKIIRNPITTRACEKNIPSV